MSASTRNLKRAHTGIDAVRSVLDEAPRRICWQSPTAFRVPGCYLAQAVLRALSLRAKSAPLAVPSALQLNVVPKPDPVSHMAEGIAIGAAYGSGIEISSRNWLSESMRIS